MKSLWLADWFPYLLVDQENLPLGLEPHAGTMDLDMGLALAILKNERYQELGRRLRDAGFEPEVNDQGNERQGNCIKLEKTS